MPEDHLWIAEAGRDALLGTPLSGNTIVFSIGNLYHLGFSRSVTRISFP
jgi:hypothetical protein